MLLVGTAEQMRPRTASKYGHIVTAVCFQPERYGARKGERFVPHVDPVQVEPGFALHVPIVTRSVRVADGGVRQLIIRPLAIINSEYVIFATLRV